MILLFHAICLVGTLAWGWICLRRLPGDLLKIKDYAREKKWSESAIELGIFLFVWAVFGVCFTIFVLPVALNLSKVSEFFSNFRI